MSRKNKTHLGRGTAQTPSPKQHTNELIATGELTGGIPLLLAGVSALIIVITAVYRRVLDHRGKIIFCLVFEPCFGEITLLRAPPGRVSFFFSFFLSLFFFFPPIEQHDKVHPAHYGGFRQIKKHFTAINSHTQNLSNILRILIQIFHA